MRLLQHGRESLVALHISGSPLFVSYPNHLQVERRGMSHLRAKASPSRLRGRAVGELNQVERVLDEGLKLIERSGLTRVELARHSTVDDRQRAGADILRQLEVFKETKPKR